MKRLREYKLEGSHVRFVERDFHGLHHLLISSNHPNCVLSVVVSTEYIKINCDSPLVDRGWVNWSRKSNGWDYCTKKEGRINDFMVAVLEDLLGYLEGEL